MAMSKLLLLSNSTMPGADFLAWPRPHISDFLSGVNGPGVFIPFAGVTISFDEYGSLVATVFEEMRHPVKSIHQLGDKKKAIEEASFIAVGGGNSFALLSRMYENYLLDAVREKVLSGAPYIGWSAGANLACPTIMTTNDMPIVQTPSLQALNLIPFQINPHYHELKFEGQGGETRRERLEEFLSINPAKRVLGLPEGMLLQRDNKKLLIKGSGVAKYYKSAKEIIDLTAGADVSYLL